MCDGRKLDCRERLPRTTRGTALATASWAVTQVAVSSHEDASESWSAGSLAPPPGPCTSRLLPFGTHRRMADVAGNEIDAYLDALEEPKQSTLARLRDTIMAIVPDAEQGISYGMPAFRLRGKTVAGFAAFKNHLSYLPHSGSVIPQLGKELEGYTFTSGSLHFPVDQPLPEALVRKLLAVRMAEAFGGR